MVTQPSSIRSDFYVYALCRGDTGEPFYIGKGKGNRWAHHEMYARRGIPGRKSEIILGMLARGVDVVMVKIHEWLTETVSHKYEIALIKAIGRGKLGPLVNLTDGGDGATGHQHTPESRAIMRGRKRSPETRARMSEAQILRPLPPGIGKKISAAKRGKKVSPETLATRFGKKPSPESNAKRSATMRGREASTEVRANMRAAAFIREAAKRAAKALLVANQVSSDIQSY